MSCEEKVRLWTFQPLSIFEKAMDKGVAFCAEESDFSKEWPWAYRWMAKEMKQRIGAPEYEGAVFPIWAWQYFKGKDKPKPRIVPESMGFDDGQQVFMELLIPKSRVLPSDFILWHSVLNKYGIDTGDGLSEEDTWSRLFDPDFNHPDWCTKPWEMRAIQATFWCLFKEDIVSAILVQRQEGKRALLKKKIFPSSTKC